MKVNFPILSQVKNGIVWAAFALLACVAVAVPALSLVELAGGTTKEWTLGPMAYICWPVTLVSLVFTLIVDSFLFKCGPEGERSLLKLLRKSTGPVTVAWSSILLLPIAMNFAATLLRWAGAADLSRLAYEWRWASQPMALGLAIVVALLGCYLHERFAHVQKNSMLLV